MPLVDEICFGWHIGERDRNADARGGRGGRQCNAQLDGGRRVCKREREREKIEEEKREKREKRDAGSL